MPLRRERSKMSGRASTAAEAVAEGTPHERSRVMKLPMATSHAGRGDERGQHKRHGSEMGGRASTAAAAVTEITPHERSRAVKLPPGDQPRR